jgi:endoglucanase
MKVPSPLRRVAAVAVGLVCALALTAAPAAAATPLPTPGTPVATTVTTTSITITWAASAGPVANYTIQLIDGGQVSWHDLARTSATSYTHTGLVPDKVYEYRIIANARPRSGYTVSSPSGYIAVTTAPLPDTEPPTKPGTPTARNITTVGATINVPFSTDNTRVAGYWVQRQVDGVWTDWATNDITEMYLRDLTPATTYTVVVVAFDPSGNRSPRSDPLTFSTLANASGPTCKVSLKIFWQQYMVDASATNLTADTVVGNWSVRFTLPAAHTVSNSFGATLTRSGDQATVSSAYSPNIGPGGAVQFGFFASYPVGSPLPSDFTLNGTGLAAPIPCTFVLAP